jgi:hypothetical protein
LGKAHQGKIICGMADDLDTGKEGIAIGLEPSLRVPEVGSVPRRDDPERVYGDSRGDGSSYAIKLSYPREIRGLNAGNNPGITPYGQHPHKSENAAENEPYLSFHSRFT